FACFGARLDALRVDHRGALVVAAGDLEEVDAFALEGADDVHRLVFAEAAALEVGGVQLHADREIGTDLGADGANDLEEETHATFGVPAPCVLALVRER